LRRHGEAAHFSKTELGRTGFNSENLLIEILLNGEKKEIPEGLTLSALLDWLNLPQDRIAVEYNLEIAPRGHWGETAVRSGDRLEVVHFVGGGLGILHSKTSQPIPCSTYRPLN